MEGMYIPRVVTACAQRVPLRNNLVCGKLLPSLVPHFLTFAAYFPPRPCSVQTFLSRSQRR